jgi:hypothetical protein
MKYAVEMGSVGVIYAPSFIKIDAGIQKLIGGIRRHINSLVIPYAYLNLKKKGG